ncbi:MAG: aromatic amino acid aminotransferase [Omnitrophica WOR_2 bacterium GWF2_43_52]|nr:MAG: aromatic amino acid aminotransferase [Omnitrophica WOR_2 bacterium GWA2_44_7]OGX15986.1 MAG: aromatic amino acid aminotransferase [Omnitrophica WOR_2 bacterium GWC2_44_8]OGX20745.1 MAG: aromatic amino acid aminotransferase [Omnitrophica WOR_2 bacterium GWF2_43_52]HAH19766.1 pyridoxal phosphate-dependent aminotransferase [Candidatus Omnitrophota bacterium]HBG63391.1 pyridoxal phosphate-dependent aminotransferase [Candidatus Omnitrophota bacterium]
MKDIISKVVQEMQPSGIRAFFDLVLGMKDVISLGVGEPDFVTPWSVRESAIFSLEQGYTSYTSNKGMMKLRLQIARFLKNHHEVTYDPDDEILITVGVSEALDLAMRAIINPGDKVLIPEPCYVSYGPVTALAGGIPVYVSTAPTGFKITPEAIERHCDTKTKAIIINYPSNPTGVSYSKRDLECLKKAILKHKLILISDEVYDELTYDFAHTSFAALSGLKNNTLYLNGFSKSYAMTGWRVGYACGPKEIIAAMTKIHQYTIMCVSITSQIAACEALQSGRKAVEEMKREYRRRREFVVDNLNRIGLSCNKPQGAFYAFASVKNTSLNSIDFCQQLLKEQKVAVVPGNAFGKSGEGYIRISYASSFSNLREALRRMEIFLKGL